MEKTKFTQIIFIGMIVALLLVFHLYGKLKTVRKELHTTTFALNSARVKFGKTFEHFVPFIKDFPGNKENSVFLGMPIDFICFDEDTIKFIDVKTGQAQLSNKQKKIKQQIEQGLVEFREVRYG